MDTKFLSLDNPIVFNWYERLIEQSISSLEGKRLQNGHVEFYKQELFKQFFTHFLATKSLSNNIKIILNGRENEISALPSIAVLIRACLENYAIFYYIYRHSSSSEEISFKFWSWYREGLLSRQRFKLKHLKAKQDEEKAQVEQLTNEMKENQFFKNFTNNQQKRYLNDGKWYFEAKQKLLYLSGFSEPLASNCYNYFSSYTHPVSSSHLQTSQVSYDDSFKIQNSILKALFISSAFYLHHYSIEFNNVGDLFNDEDKDFIQSWCFLGNELMT